MKVSINYILYAALFIFCACGKVSEDTYDAGAYEPDPLSADQIEAEAKSFYLDNRYVFKQWVNGVGEGNEYDQKENQRRLDSIMMDLIVSDKYADGDASKIWGRALNIAVYEDN